MKKVAKVPDELRQEYDFASMPGGVRGKYAARHQEGANIVKLDILSLARVRRRLHPPAHDELT